MRDTGHVVCRGVGGNFERDVLDVERLAVGGDGHNEDLMTSSVVAASPRQFHRLPRQWRHWQVSWRRRRSCNTKSHATGQNASPISSQLSHPSGVGKWVPASAGKAKAGMVHSVSGCTRGVQVKLWDHVGERAILERLGGVIMARRYTKPRLPSPYLIFRVSPVTENAFVWLKIAAPSDLLLDVVRLCAL